MSQGTLYVVPVGVLRRQEADLEYWREGKDGTPYRAGGVLDWFVSTDSCIAPSIRGGLCVSIFINLGWFCDLPW